MTQSDLCLTTTKLLTNLSPKPMSLKDHYRLKLCKARMPLKAQLKLLGQRLYLVKPKESLPTATLTVKCKRWAQYTFTKMKRTLVQSLIIIMIYHYITKVITSPNYKQSLSKVTIVAHQKRPITICIEICEVCRTKLKTYRIR